MTGFKKAYAVFEAKKFHKKVEIGNGSTSYIKGVGSISLQLDSGTLINIGEILYVPSLKNNVISMTVLEDKGFSVTFSEGKALVWPKGGSMSSAIVTGVREGDLYKVSGNVVTLIKIQRSRGSQLCSSVPNKVGLQKRKV